MAVEPLVQLSDKYRQEFEQTFNGLRQRVNVAEVQAKVQQTVNDLQPTLTAKKDEAVAVLGDLESPISAPAIKVLETFGYAAVLQFIFGFVTIFTGIVLAPVLNLVLDNSPVILAAYLLVPYLAYQNIIASTSESDNHFTLLSTAVGEGVLVGFLLSNRFLPTSGPVVFLTPLVIALFTHFGDGKLATRTSYLGAVVGSGLVLHLLVGAVSGNLGFGYFLLALLYSAAGFASVQLSLKDVNPALVQLAFFVAVLLAQGIVYGGLGVAKQDLPAQQ